LLEVGTGFHPEMTGRENIYLNGAILGMRKKEITRKLDEIIDFSGVERYIDTPVKRYSSGMYVRLAFAVAAYLESEILIVDEVLAVGDAEFQKKCLGKMGDITAKDGRTVLFVSHNLAAVKSLCNRGILLENGLVGYNGNVDDAICQYFSNEVYVNHSDGVGIFNFLYHKDKLDNNYGILKAELFCDEVLSNVVYSGSKVELKLYYNSPRDYIESEIGFVIKDSSQISFMGINNRHLGNHLKISKGLGEAVITILDFPLYSSMDYWFNLYFGDSGPNYEILENAIKFKLVTKDVYGSGRKLDTVWNKVVHKKIQIKTL
jgi:lipopolysaccharide transport system ATP-binding protein